MPESASQVSSAVRASPQRASRRSALRETDVDGAIASFRQSICTDPNYPEVHSFLHVGDMLMVKGDLKGAK